MNKAQKLIKDIKVVLGIETPAEEVKLQAMKLVDGTEFNVDKAEVGGIATMADGTVMPAGTYETDNAMVLEVGENGEITKLEAKEVETEEERLAREEKEKAELEKVALEASMLTLADGSTVTVSERAVGAQATLDGNPLAYGRYETSDGYIMEIDWNGVIESYELKVTFEKQENKILRLEKQTATLVETVNQLAELVKQSVEQNTELKTKVELATDVKKLPKHDNTEDKPTNLLANNNPVVLAAIERRKNLKK